MGHLYSSRLEKKAIGLICTASKAGRLLFAGLDETHFTRSATRQAFRRIRTLARERNEIPSYDDLCDDSTIDESARTELRQFEYTWEPTLKRALFLSENLTRYRKARLLLDMAEKVTDGLKNQSFDPDKIIRESQDIIDKTRTGKKVPSVSIGGKNDKVLDAVKSALDGKSYRVWPTGFEAFDSVNRGIFEGSYFVLAGDTGGGKTAMALQIGNNMADAGAKVGMFSLEMTTDELLLREIARRANMSMTKLISGQLLRSEKIKAYKKFKEQHRKYQRDDKRITFLAPDEDIAIEEALYMLKPYGYDVIIIDYITLLKGSGGERQAQALSEISRFCKLYAKANKCVVIMLCQFDSKDAVVRYSRAIREHANNMWVWVRDAKAMETHILTIMQQKARNQRMFIFQLYEDFDKMRVKDVPEDYQPPANDNDDRPAKKYANDKRDRGGGSSNKPSPQQKKRFELQ